MAISGVTADGRVLLRAHARALQSPNGVRHLLRHSAGRLLVIWEGAPLQRGQDVKQVLAAGGAARLHREQRPGYAPAPNPDDGFWDYVKRVERRTVCCRDQRHLRRALRVAGLRLRHKPHVIHGCIRQAGCHL